MAKIHKVELYLVDYNDRYDIEDVKAMFENRFDLAIKEIKRDTRDFEWDDDLKINTWNATIDDYEEYFK